MGLLKETDQLIDDRLYSGGQLLALSRFFSQRSLTTVYFAEKKPYNSPSEVGDFTNTLQDKISVKKGKLHVNGTTVLVNNEGRQALPALKEGQEETLQCRKQMTI